MFAILDSAYFRFGIFYIVMFSIFSQDALSRGQLLRLCFSRAVVKVWQLLRSGRRLRSGRCKAQILPSSTCKASVGDRQTNKGFRASGVPPEELMSAGL
jgi:hypothetical protein